MKYREGLLLGSACEAGELYQCDSYVEVRRIRRSHESCNSMIIWRFSHWETMRLCCADDKESGELRGRSSKDINRQDRTNWESSSTNLVVATCDVHFIDPQDDGIPTVSSWQAKALMMQMSRHRLFLRTTEEMLEEFEYLGQ
ncbi:MAG: hypothetical protein ACLUD0_18595 [Eubacterium ramulus]